MKTLSIIVLSYNTEELLANCLRSIYTHLSEKLFELIVVDNASKDGSVVMVKKEFPKVILIQSSENQGFAKGANLGVKKATGKYFLFLNSDAVLEDDKIHQMIEFMNELKRASIVGGQLVNTDGTRQRSFGRFYTLSVVFAMLIAGDKGEMWNRKSTESREVDWVSGGFMMVRREVFEKLKGFDEGFFMYLEDMELCYRARKAGHAVYFFPKSKVIHLHQGSSNRAFAIRHIYKGLVYFYRKHRNPIELFLLKILLRAKAFALIIGGMLTGNAYLKNTYSRALQF